jgi:putative hemolysin
VTVTLVCSALASLRDGNGETWKWKHVPLRYTQRLLAHHSRITNLFNALRTVLLLTVGLLLVTLTTQGLQATWTVVVASLAGTLLATYLVQMSTQALGRRYCHRIMPVLAPIISTMDWAFAPVFFVTRQAGPPLGRGTIGNPNFKQNQPSSLEGNPSSVPVDSEVREADLDERRMIYAILHLEDASAREIMVPRVDVVVVEVSASLTEVATVMANVGHSRLPIYKENIDDIVGIVHARDVLQKIGSEQNNIELLEVARPALFVPDSKPIDELLKEFQERRVTIAVVVDEYGGTEGIITMEDLLEEIVGEIEDEFTKQEPTVIRIGEREAIMDGRVSLDDLNEIFQTDLVGDGYDTLGGLLYHQLGKIPIIGESVALQGLSIEIISTSGRRVRKVRVIRTV